MEKTERIQWIDALKFFAILLVVWGHVLPRLQPTPIELKYVGVTGWIYSFHMPLFMTLSGFVSQRIVRGEGSVIRKFKQLIVPCIILAIICFAIGFNENFWYLKSLFICYVIALYFFRCKIKHKWIILIVGCVVLFPLICRIPYFGSYKIDFMLPYFFLGVILSCKKEYLYKHLHLITLLTGLFFFVCSIVWSPEYVWYNSTPNWIDYKVAITYEGSVINTYSLWTYTFRFITGAVASTFFVGLFMIVYSYNMGPHAFREKLAYCGGYSLHVYILQAFIVRWALERLDYILPIHSIILYPLATLVISFLIVVLSIKMSKVLEYNRYLNRFLFGKI